MREQVTRWLGGAVGIAAVLFMVTPLILVVLFAFGNSPKMTFPLNGLTLHWFDALLVRGDFWAALRNSAIVTGSVGIASTIIGTMAASAIARFNPKWSAASFFFFGLPLMLPPLVLGLAMLAFFSATGVRLSLGTVVLAHLVFTLPFVVLVVSARLASFDRAILDSARDLGASPIRAFRTVTFPVIRPTIFGAALIAMALSLDDFVVTFFLIGGGNTLPTLIWGMLRTGLDPSINALGSLVLIMTMGTAGVALWLTRYRS
jgi:spermidine/putrescine transport system permease protein